MIGTRVSRNPNAIFDAFLSQCEQFQVNPGIIFWTSAVYLWFGDRYLQEVSAISALASRISSVRLTCRVVAFAVHVGSDIALFFFAPPLVTFPAQSHCSRNAAQTSAKATSASRVGSSNVAALVYALAHACRTSAAVPRSPCCGSASGVAA